MTKSSSRSKHKNVSASIQNTVESFDQHRDEKIEKAAPQEFQIEYVPQSATTFVSSALHRSHPDFFSDLAAKDTTPTMLTVLRALRRAF